MLNERKLTENEIEQRKIALKGLLKNKRALVQKYGADAEKVMYGIATKQAKKKVENMNLENLRGMIQDALKNPKAADLNKDGKLSDYEEKRGAAIEKNMNEDYSNNPNDRYEVKYSKSNDTYQVWEGDVLVTDFATEERAKAEAKRLNALEDARRVDKSQVGEALNPEVSQAVNRFIKAMAKRYSYSEQDAVFAIMAALKQRDFDGLNENINEQSLDYNFSEDEIKRVLKLLKSGASTEIGMIKAFEKALGRELTDDEVRGYSINPNKVGKASMEEAKKKTLKKN